MDVVIKKRKHYSSWKFPKLYNTSKEFTISKLVTFTESCRYDLGSTDQYDINKLFGIGYFPWHHYNSVRFGWRYDLFNKDIAIFSYWYSNKIRKYELLGSVEIDVPYIYSISIYKNYHELFIFDNKFVPVMQHKVTMPSQKIGYYLKPFFGGNRTAPHDMLIKIY